MLYLGVRLLLPHSDVLLLPIVTLLTGIGLVMIFRLTYDMEGAENLATTQAVWILVGSGAMFLLVLFFRNYRLFDYKYLLAIAAVVLIASTFTPFGYEVNGARLWVAIGPVNFQPSEFARIALVIFFAGYLAEKRDVMTATSRTFLGSRSPRSSTSGPWPSCGPPLWAPGLREGPREQPLFFAVPLLMLYTATGRIAYVLLGGILFSIGSLVTYFLFSHVQLRVQSWLDPWEDPDGTGFQILQSIFNIADGGLTGTGLGAGFSQTIPEVETDFIFSAIASELGLLGATAVLLRSWPSCTGGSRSRCSRGRVLEAPRLRAHRNVRPPDPRHRRRGDEGHTADRHHAPLRLLRRLLRRGQLHPDGRSLVISEKAGRREAEEPLTRAGRERARQAHLLPVRRRVRGPGRDARLLAGLRQGVAGQQPRERAPDPALHTRRRAGSSWPATARRFWQRACAARRRPAPSTTASTRKEKCSPTWSATGAPSTGPRASRSGATPISPARRSRPPSTPDQPDERRPQPGNNVVLTLDPELQRIAYNDLAASRRAGDRRWP